MNILYYFRHMESSEALKFDVEQRLAALEPLIQSSTPIHVTFSVNQELYTVHVGLHARNNNHVDVQEKSEEMYKSIDMAFETLRRVVTREKEKQTHHHMKIDAFAKQAHDADLATNVMTEHEYIDAETVLHNVQATGR